MAKVTKNDLEKLIEGVLSEKELPITIPPGTPKATLKKDLLGITSTKPTADLILKIAAGVDPKNKLTKSDFEEAFKEPINTEVAEAALAIYLNTGVDNKMRADVLDAYQGSNYNEAPENKKANPNKFKVDQRVAGKESIKSKFERFMKRVEELFDAAETAEAKKAVIDAARQKAASAQDLSRQQLAALEDIFTSYEETGDLPTPDIPQYRTTDQGGNWEKKKNFGQIPSATLAVFTNFSKNLNTADEITDRLLKFSDLFTGVGTGDTDKEAQLRAEIQKDPGLVLSASMVLKVFSRVVREIEDMEAGKFFESFCAMLYSGRVVGGEAGASDVFIYTDQGQPIYTSQKLYSDLEGVKQKEGKKSPDGKGVWADTQDDKPIFYFVGIKEEGKLGAKVDIYICGVARVTGTDEYYMIDKDGERRNIQAFVHTDNNVQIGKAMSSNRNLFKVGEIQTADPVDPEAFRSMDALINRVFTTISDDAIQAARAVYKKSKTIEVNTTKYSQTDDFAQQMNLADEMVTSYNDLKGDLGDFLVQFSKEDGPINTQTQSKVKQIKESETITASQLQKLIEEKFKK